MARAGKLQYELSGEYQQCLQIILELNDSILVNCNTICWMSDQITVEKIDTFFSAFFGNKTDNLKLLNHSEPVKFVGLAQNQSGRILVLKNSMQQRGLYFFRESFVCAHGVSEITARLFPDIGRERNLYLTIPAIHKRVKSILHCTPSVNSTLFFQAGSEIMKKYLQTGQCILVNLWSVVAFDDTCSIQLLNISQITYSFIGCQGIMLRIEGPGNVYFSSHGSGPRSSQELLPQLQSQRLIPSPLSICLNLAMYFLILFLVLMLLGHYFIDEEFLEELKRQLEQLERNNNQNNRNPLGGDNADEF